MPPRILHYSDLETVYDDPDRAARLAGLVADRRDDRTLVVGTGDDLGPSVLSVVTDARQAVDLFERIRPDAETFGNHDFDYGPGVAREVVAETPQAWLNANVFLEGERFAADAGAVARTVVRAGESRVGLVGVTTPNLPEMNHRAEALEVTDPVAAARRQARTLREEGVDYVVVCSHCGDERDLARSLDVDAVLGGHAHDVVVDRVGGTTVTRPGAGGHRVLEVDLDGGVRRHDVSEARPDPEVRSVLRGRIRETGLDETVARVAQPVERTRETSGRGESRIGNFVTDAYRWAAGADLALIAARAVRESPPLAGDVTAYDLLEGVPFDDDLVVLGLDGRRLLETFEWIHHGEVPTMPDWYVGHVSGARLAFDGPDLDRAAVGGAPVDADDDYRVATSRYYVETDHIFPTFGPGDVARTVGPHHEALVEYARREGIDPGLEGRIRLAGER